MLIYKENQIPHKKGIYFYGLIKKIDKTIF